MTAMVVFLMVVISTILTSIIAIVMFYINIALVCTPTTGNCIQPLNCWSWHMQVVWRENMHPNHLHIP